jgi:aspartyl-tRNA(Asn)/glutamyl-tRNA(Gln) amidotransferase subunit A
MAGHDPRDPTSSHHPVGPYADGEADLHGLRIGVPTDWFFEICDPEVTAATRTAIETLAGAGATVVDVALPNAHLADVIGWTIMFAEFASLHEVHLDRLDDYGPGLTRQLLASSQFVSAQDYLRALRTRHLIQSDFEAVFERVDALVTPGIVSAAPRLDAAALEIEGKEYPLIPTVVRTTLIYNLAGVPALSIPAGLNADGLPVGIQIAARPFAEATCFRVADAYQRLTDHHLARPSMLARVEQLAADH